MTDKTDALIRKLAAHVRPTCSGLYDEAMQALAAQPAEGEVEMPEPRFWMDSVAVNRFRKTDLAYMAGGYTYVSTCKTRQYDEPYFTAEQMRAAMSATPPAASVDVEGLRELAAAMRRTSTLWAAADYADALDALIDSAGGAKGECCVPGEGEPSFVFLGRDPQAPTLIEQWADERERAEPDSTKPAAARDIARRMRKFKNANPDKGLPASAITPQPAEGDGAVYQWHEFAGRWEDFTKEQFDEVQSSGEIVLGETIITPAMTRKLYTRPAATAVVPDEPDPFLAIERAVASLPPGYAFQDAVEHAAPAGPKGGVVVSRANLESWHAALSEEAAAYSEPLAHVEQAIAEIAAALATGEQL